MNPSVHATFRRLRGFLLAAAIVIAVGFSLPWRALETLENLSLDLRHHLRPDAAAVAPVVVVGVGDASFKVVERAPREAGRDPVLAAMGQPWPWDRSVFAAVVKKLRAAGARAVVFDFVLTAKTAGDPEFARVLAAPGAPVVFASLVQTQHSAEGEGTATVIEARPEFLAASGVSAGFANVWPDDDGVVRQARVRAGWEELLTGRPAPADGREAVRSLAGATLHALGVATVDGGYVAFRGPPDRFSMVPIEDLFFADRWGGARLAGGTLFRDRVVIVGPWSEVVFKDYHATPLGRMAGAELQAHIIASGLEGGLLRRAPWGFDVGLVFAMTVLAALGTGLPRAAWHVIGLMLVAIAWSGLAFGALAGANWILPVAAPLGALVTMGAAGLSLRYVGEQRERRRMRRLLASYVSEAVARVIVRQPEGFEAAMRGVRRPVTVLFSDIRDFTQLSERSAPEALIAQLNEYLTAMVDGVLTNEGTLQKFIGDAILAVWGDTHSAGDRADACRAVAAALAMEHALGPLNAGWAGRPDRVPLRIGIGLHQGPAMVGNIGHPRRMEFGVLGDTVNLASRLEGATRFFGTTILVGESVRNLAEGEFRFAPVARVIVKGRTQPVEVSTPIGPRTEPEPAWLARYESALATMQAGRFTEAATEFAALPADHARFAPLFAQQAARAKQLALAPPPEWNGAIRLEQK